MKLKLPAWSVFVVALATIYRSAFTGLKRYFGVLPTLGTHRGEHLARPVAIAASASASASVTLCLSCLAASWASLGLIGIAFGLEELLLLASESEGSPAIGTLK